MTITITLDTNNAAFDNDRVSRAHTEVARLVGQVANWFDTDGPHDGPLYDYNGNHVGDVAVSGGLDEADDVCDPLCASRVPFGSCTCGRVDRQAARGE
jgi:hypothetical protein